MFAAVEHRLEAPCSSSEVAICVVYLIMRNLGSRLAGVALPQTKLANQRAETLHADP